MLTVLIETTIDLAIEGELLVRVHNTTQDASNHERMSAYLTIFALAQLVWILIFLNSKLTCLISVFQFIMAVDAVHARNTLQFLFLTYVNIRPSLSTCSLPQCIQRSFPPLRHHTN